MGRYRTVLQFLAVVVVLELVLFGVFLAAGYCAQLGAP